MVAQSNSVSSLSSFSTLFKENKYAFVILALLQILVIIASNYLVQIPIKIDLNVFWLGNYHDYLNIDTTWGAFTFPFVFLITDLTVRMFGSSLARKIVFSVMLPALIITYIISIIFYNGEYQGFSGFKEVNVVVLRIAFASFCAYCFGQLLDISVFNKLRQIRSWWVAPMTSTIVGNIIDALLFFFIAFYQSSDVFMAENWVNIALADYVTRMIICTVFFLPMYGVILNYLLSKLQTSNSILVEA